ncbi:unnamed protein product [Meloidogyne enterolobii]|uniref:Uncharacterized protein n=1 Tax=Meloidogyne enterolobii TaxID=390850 RepID=A0ACB0XTX3_MELEN
MEDLRYKVGYIRDLLVTNDKFRFNEGILRIPNIKTDIGKLLIFIIWGIVFRKLLIFIIWGIVFRKYKKGISV